MITSLGRKSYLKHLAPNKVKVSDMKIPGIQRGTVQTALGSIYYLMSDGRNTTINTTDQQPFNAKIEKPPILCFHMSPRSSDEYLEVLPLLAAGGDGNDGRVVIAFDLPGYGASENPPHSCSVDDISDACLKAADFILLGADSTDENDDEVGPNYVPVGSLLGNYFATSLASRYPKRIKAGILTNPWFDPEAKGMVKETTTDTTNILDSFVLQDDGSHLTDIHFKRNKWLDPDMNLRMVQSELAYLANRRNRYPKGISLEGGSDYDFRLAVQKIVDERSDGGVPFLCIRGEACATMFDQFGLDGTNRFNEASALLMGGSNQGSCPGHVRIETLKGATSTLNVVNQMPEEFAAICNQFLADHKL